MEILRNKPNMVSGLLGDLRQEFSQLIREEVQLAKTEMTEKAGKLGRNAVAMVVGGVAAYLGLILLLVGIGFLLAYAFQSVDMQPALANFLGFAIVGLIGIAVGAILILKAKKTFSQESLKPEKTIDTLTMKSERQKPIETPEPIKETSDDLQARVVDTRHEMQRTLGEIRGRFQLANQSMKDRIRSHPGRSVLIGLACGLASGMVLKQGMRRRKARRTREKLQEKLILRLQE